MDTPHAHTEGRAAAEVEVREHGRTAPLRRLDSNWRVLGARPSGPVAVGA